MNIREFAEQHRFKTVRDECDDVIVPGRFGHVYEYSAELLGACVISRDRRGDPKPPSPYRWNRAREAFVKAGMTITQSGDAEGCAIFSAKDEKQIRVAVQQLGIRPKRQMSPERRRAL